MDRLEMTLLEVAATRSCQLLTVIGDAGVGKSRLVREFAARAAARERSQVLRGRCLPYGDGVTFWPIAEIVRNAAAISDEDPREVAIAKIDRDRAERHGARRRSGRGRRPGGGGDRAVRQPSSRARSCSGGSAGCSRRSRAGARWSRSSTTSTWPPRPSSSCSTTCSTPSTARRSCCSPRPAASCWRRGPSGPRATRTSRSSSTRSPADDAEAIIGQLLGGLEPSVRERIVSSRRGQPALRRADHGDAGRDRGDPPRRRGLGRHRVVRRDRHPADRPGACRGPSRRAPPRGAPGRSIRPR